MKLLKILLVILVLLALVAGGALLVVNRYLHSAGFKETALAAVQSAGGARVEVTDLDISLWSGVTLRGIKVANPPGFAGNLLQAEAFVLRYRLLPLLHQRLEITQLELQKPVVALVQNEGGAWNYEKLGGAPAAAAAPGPAPSPAGGAGTGTVRKGGFDVSLSRLALTHGDVLMLGPDNTQVLKLQDLQLTSGVDLAGGALRGTGKAGIGEINVANKLFVRNVTATVVLAPEAIKLVPLRGTLAGGTVTGAVAVAASGAFGYHVDLHVAGADLVELLREAGTREALTGKLTITAKLAGTGGLPTMTGQGRATIADGQLAEIPLLNLVAILLQIPELRGVKFSECLLEFTLADNVLQTPVIKLTAPNLQLTGHGQVALADFTLDHTFTLAVHKDLLAKVPKEMRGLFAERQDDYRTIEFKVTGPYDAPKTDLKSRLVQGATEQLLQKFLK